MNDPLPRCPPEAEAVAHSLLEAGHRIWWLGESLARAIEGRPLRSVTLRSDASFEQVCAALPDAIVVGRTDGDALAVRTPGAPDPPAKSGITHVDVLARRDDRPLDHVLADAPFTRQAVALEVNAQGVQSEGWCDPTGGRDDLANSLLRTTGDPVALFASRPDLALRALRHLGEDGLEGTPELMDALAGCKPDLRGLHVPRIRLHLRSCFAHPNPRGALQAMHDHGFASKLAPGCREDAPAIVAAVEANLERRLVAWLRDASASRALRKLRFGAPLGARVLVLLDHHPVDAPGRGGVIPTALRHRRRLAPADLAFLLRLRTLEIEQLALAQPAAAEAARRSLAAMQAALEEAARADELERARHALVLDGDDIMRLLGCSPGRHVGEALQHLARLVAEDGCANAAAELEKEVKRWAELHRPPRSGEGPAATTASE